MKESVFGSEKKTRKTEFFFSTLDTEIFHFNPPKSEIFDPMESASCALQFSFFEELEKGKKLC